MNTGVPLSPSCTNDVIWSQSLSRRVHGVELWFHGLVSEKQVSAVNQDISPRVLRP